jgi:ATP-dependent protease ClpP protease subunit
MLLVRTANRIKHLKVLINSPGAATGAIASGFLIIIVNKIRDMWMWTGFDMIMGSDKGRKSD